MKIINMKTIEILGKIFRNITYEDLSMLDKIIDTPEISKADKNKVKKFIQQCKEAKKIISQEDIKEIVGTYGFFNCDMPIQELIDKYIIISKRENVCNILKEVETDVLENGVTEDSIKKLNKIKTISTASIEDEYKDMTAIDLLEEYKEKNINRSNISTCVKALDKITGGIQKGKLTSILGATSCFKTTWALNIVYAAQIQGLNTLYFTLEVSKEDIRADLLSRYSNQEKFRFRIEHKDIKQKKLSEEELEYLESEIVPNYENLTRKNIFIR